MAANPHIEGAQAFSLKSSPNSRIPVLIAVPHAGRDYPEDVLARMRAPDAACLKLEDRLVDAIGERVADATGAALLVANAPRAVIDLNRAPDDMDWSMLENGSRHRLAGKRTGPRARGGLGLVPRRLPGHGEIWRSPMTEGDLRLRIDTIHRPYHAALATTLAAIHKRWGAALLLDLHSMPPLPGSGAKFVVGDRFGSSCAGFVPAIAFDSFARAGVPAAHNRPYAGGYVLDRHGDPSRNIHAVQLEICRDLYLTPDRAATSEGIDTVSEIVTGLVQRLAAEIAGQGGARRAAAE